MSWFIAFVGTLTLLAAVAAVELVAPFERHTAGSRLKGFLFTSAAVVTGVLTVAALERLWQSVGVPPISTIPLRGILGDAASVAALIIISDFLAYWHHRAQHRFFWPIHALHHSQTELHAANAYAHFLEKATQFLLIAVPLSLVRFNAPETPLIVIAARQVMEFYIHSPTGAHLGALRLLVVDNRFHRLHHSLEPQHFDRNFGILLSVWDRLFGTAVDPKPDEWPATGLSNYKPPATLSEYLLYPVAKTVRTGQAVMRR